MQCSAVSNARHETIEMLIVETSIWQVGRQFYIHHRTIYHVSCHKWREWICQESSWCNQFTSESNFAEAAHRTTVHSRLVCNHLHDAGHAKCPLMVTPYNAMSHPRAADLNTWSSKMASSTMEALKQVMFTAESHFCLHLQMAEAMSCDNHNIIEHDP